MEITMNRFVKSAPPLLTTESREEFDADAKASEQTRLAENTMSATTHDAELELIFRPALLRSESASEYQIFRSQIYNELAPTTRIERDLVNDYVEAAWECRRLGWLGQQLSMADSWLHSRTFSRQRPK